MPSALQPMTHAALRLYLPKLATRDSLQRPVKRVHPRIPPRKGIRMRGGTCGAGGHVHPSIGRSRPCVGGLCLVLRVQGRTWPCIIVIDKLRSTGNGLWASGGDLIWMLRFGHGHQQMLSASEGQLHPVDGPFLEILLPSYFTASRRIVAHCGRRWVPNRWRSVLLTVTGVPAKLRRPG